MRQEEFNYNPPIEHLKIQTDWNGMSTVIQVIVPYVIPESGKRVNMLLWSHAGSEGPFDVEDLIDVVARQIRRTDFSARYES